MNVEQILERNGMSKGTAKNADILRIFGKNRNRRGVLIRALERAGCYTIKTTSTENSRQLLAWADAN